MPDSKSIENSKTLWNLLKKSEAKLDTSMDQVQALITERKKHLKKIEILNKRISHDTKSAIESFEIISSTLIKGDSSYCKKVAKLSAAICEELGFTNEVRTSAEVISRMHLTGLLFSGLSDDEFIFHPEKALFLFDKFTALKKFSSVFSYLDEFFDGSGPNSRKGKNLPKEIRVVRGAAFYYYLYNQDMNAGEIAKELDKNSGRNLDPGIVSAIYKILVRKDFFSDSDIMAVGLKGLLPGMTLVSGVFSIKGAMLLPSGTRLDEKMIDKIVSYDKGEPVVENILIRRLS